MKQSLASLILLSCTALSVARAASNCPAGGTTIFYGNGVLTTQARAASTLNTLMFSIDHALDVKAPQRDPSCVRYGLAYDSLFVNDKGLLGDVYNLIGQLITAAIQKGLTDQSRAQSDLYQSNLDSPSPPDTWDSAVGPTYVADFASFVAANQPDVQTHVALYMNELTSRNAVLVIAHSQGNLYANQAYSFIGAPHDQFYTIALATPANNVLGELPPITLDTQLTLNNDLILFIPGAISPGNISNTNTPGRCGSGIGSRYRCHDVVNSYLLGNASGPAIINAVVSQTLKQLTITKSGAGTGTVASAPSLIDCGSTCSGYLDRGTTVSLTATPDQGSSLTSWGGDCASAGMNTTAQVTLTSDKSCTATFGSANPAVRLNPFGNQNGTVPYNVQVVDSTLMVTPAPQDITVTLLREVFSECSGLLFSSNRTVVVSKGQSSATFNFDAGHDPACNTLPITTVYTVTKAVLAPSTVLDLSGVPPQQLMLFSMH
jgi:hypothetical protein